MYCPKCAYESPDPGACLECGTTMLPDDQPNPAWEQGHMRFHQWQIVLITLITVVGVAYYLRLMNVF